MTHNTCDRKRGYISTRGTSTTEKTCDKKCGCISTRGTNTAENTCDKKRGCISRRGDSTVENTCDKSRGCIFTRGTNTAENTCDKKRGCISTRDDSAAEGNSCDRKRGCISTRGTSSASSSPVEVCDNSWVTSCGCGYTLDHDNADRAMVGISEQCGDVVAFICFGGPTGRSHISSAAQQITTVCGLGIAGSAALGQGLFYEPTIGYMCYEPCLDFCVNSKVSFASHC